MLTPSVSVSTSTSTCEKCGVVLAVGDWPFCPHPHFDRNTSGMLGEFRGRFDIGLGVYTSSLGDRKRAMRGISDAPGDKPYKWDYRGKKVGDPGCEV